MPDRYGYIGIETLLNCCENTKDHAITPYQTMRSAMDHLQRILRGMPSAQPERIRGRWVKDEEASNQHVEPIYICSACNNMDAWGEVEKNTFKFCPNCGADMREDE